MAELTESSVERYCAELESLKTEKAPWDIHYQAIAETFLTRKQDFTHAISPGEFLQDDIFDNTGQVALYTMAAAVLAMMWPDAARSMRLKPVRRLRELPGVERYFDFVNDEMYAAMDNPDAGLSLALMEYFIDQAAFGICGVAAIESEPDEMSLPIYYDTWGVKSMYCTENAYGAVDRIFYVETLTVRQLVGKYNRPDDIISPKVLEAWKAPNTARRDEKIEVLTVLEPKTPERDKNGFIRPGVAGMSARTCHIDLTNRIEMREGGVQDMFVFVGRFYKTVGEVQGRSPAMSALPFARSLNVLEESTLVAAEKQLDPPLAMQDCTVLGGGSVDTSAHALNIVETDGRVGSGRLIEPLFTVGEFQFADKKLEQLKQAVMQSFLLDRLMDLGNSTQMTAFEVSVRNKMRGDALGSIFSRQEKEIFTPLITRTFNVLYRRGMLGVVDVGVGGKLRRLWKNITGIEEVVVPPAVAAAAAASLEVFEIEYISPAKRFMQAEKLQGMMTVLEAMPNLSLLPGAIDNIDVDAFTRNLVQYTGTPRDVLRLKDDVAKVRAAAAQMQRAATLVAGMKDVAEAGRNVAQADATRAGMGMNGGRTSK